MPHRRASSFAGLLGKLLPSHRPEQGNTFRDEDHSGDSGYRDLGINPEELTEWNVAQDLSPRRRAELAELESVGRRRAASLATQKLLSRVNNTPRTAPGAAEFPNVPVRVSSRSEDQPNAELLSPTQVHALLRAKETSRQERRRLKASGDYLPVTGFDPRTGEWEVITPTDTLSSDSIPSSREEKVARLELDALKAEVAYEQAKSRVGSEKERLKLEKAQVKLAKLQTAKNELKREGDNWRWSNHGGHWQSAAQPSLSPIESLNSIAPSSMWMLPSTPADWVY